MRFLLLPLPEFNMLPFGGFLDKLRFSADEEDYSQQKYCQWKIVGLSAGQLVSSSGVSIEIPFQFDEVSIEHYDYLVVFGGRSAQACISLAEQYKPLLRRAAAKGLTLVSVDNASFLFAAAGLMEQRQVAVHWRHVREFETAFPTIRVQPDQLFCLDGKRISCAGGTAAIELAVALLARHCGRNKALKGLADMLVDEARCQQHHLKSLNDETQAVHGTNRHVGRAIGLMRQHLSGKKSVTELVEELGLCRRQLDRLFQAEFSCTVSDYWTAMRLTHTRWRLHNSTYTLSIIADEAGFSDVSYFCKVFKKYMGVTPNQYRASIVR
ncbi:GlxA family transcriptional regulator [Photobacterium nomapromontoriensis]|uniref:GlxA family transcriptional regulator n=1 Tax=Photobacterium nomapromontoriensis TaxID=2910237 RepID=UPI003D0A3174